MNNASIILFIVGTVVLIFSFSLKMSNFLDVRSIFLEHFSVFKGNPLQLVSIFYCSRFIFYRYLKYTLRR